MFWFSKSKYQFSTFNSKWLNSVLIVYSFGSSSGEESNYLCAMHQTAPRNMRQLCNGFFFLHLGSISTSFYEQLLRAQIPKAQKKTVKSSSFFVRLGPAFVKAAHKHIDEIDPRWYFALTEIRHQQRTTRGLGRQRLAKETTKVSGQVPCVSGN